MDSYLSQKYFWKRVCKKPDWTLISNFPFQVNNITSPIQIIFYVDIEISENQQNINPEYKTIPHFIMIIFMSFIYQLMCIDGIFLKKNILHIFNKESLFNWTILESSFDVTTEAFACMDLVNFRIVHLVLSDSL